MLSDNRHAVNLRGQQARDSAYRRIFAGAFSRFRRRSNFAFLNVRQMPLSQLRHCANGCGWL